MVRLDFHFEMNRLFILCTLFSLVKSECNPNTGPSGIIECFQSSQYNHQYQWGTCITDVYAKTKSNGKYGCSDQSVTYCYNQCMLELHDTLSGPVYSDCACKPGEEYTESNLTLPSYCYSPSGTECDWYRDCLQRRYGCRESNNDYGMTFATKFCNLYDQNYEDFSTEGRLWINSVRKCLQVSLVPIIRPWQSFNCEEIKKQAFASHVSCYVSPNPESPVISLCNLGLNDFLHVFWTIKSSLPKSLSEAVSGLWKSTTNCASNILKNFSFKDNLRNVKLALLVTLQDNRRRRRSLTNSNRNTQTISDSIVNKIAEQINFEKRGIIWFTYVKNSIFKTQKQELFINIFLANQHAYDLNAKNKSSANMNDIVLDFQTKVREGNLFAATNEFAYEAISMKGCLDIGCKKIQFEVKAPNKDTQSYTTYIIGAIVCVSIFFVLIGVAKTRYIRKRPKQNTVAIVVLQRPRY